MAATASVLKVLLSCLIVVGLIGWMSWLYRRYGSAFARTKRKLRLLEALPLGGGKALLLVTYGKRLFLIGATPHQLSLLAELMAEEFPEGREKSSPKKLRGEDGHENRKRFPWLTLLMGSTLTVLSLGTLSAQTGDTSQLSLTREALQIFLILTLIALAPFLLAVMTCFTRIVIVLSLLRLALGTPQTPPNPVIIGMALFLTLFVMAPTFQRAHEEALKPFLQGQLTLEEAFTRGYKPFQRFMLRQAREKDIALFLRLGKLPNPRRPEDVPPYVLIPAFVLGEVRTGFEIGFLLAVPFLVVDLVIASVLMGMGMLMVPPMLISLPFKLLLFVLADGWHLLMQGLAMSFR